VTGDKSTQRRKGGVWQDTHPDAAAVRGFEWLAALVFGIGAAATFQVALLGLAVGYALLSAMNHGTWGESWLRCFAWIPFTAILLGMALGGMSLLGIQPVFFGFSFHF